MPFCRSLALASTPRSPSAQARWDRFDAHVRDLVDQAGLSITDPDFVRHGIALLDLVGQLAAENSPAYPSLGDAFHGALGAVALLLVEHEGT